MMRTRDASSACAVIAVIAVIAIAATACGGGGSDGPDARPVDLGCLTDNPTLTAIERQLIQLPADSWTTLPGTAFEPFCRANGLVEFPPDDAYRCVNEIEAWGGGVFDPAERVMIVWGGGHNDYAGNEVYGFDLAAGAWRLLAPPTPLAEVTPGQDPYADGHPASRHTYDGFAYLGDLRRMFAYGGSRHNDGSSTPTTWLFDPTTGAWTRRADFDLPSGSGLFWMGTAYDEVTHTVFSRSDAGLNAYDVVGDTWTQLADFGYPPYYPEYSTSNYRRGVMVPDRRLFFALGGQAGGGAPDILVWDADTRQDVTSAWATSGDTSVIASTGIGVDYDRAAGALVAWHGGAPAALDLATRVWTRGSATGAPATSVDNGTYGRWRYVDYLNVFILVNHPGDDVAFYKHTGGCGTP